MSQFSPNKTRDFAPQGAAPLQLRTAPSPLLGQLPAARAAAPAPVEAPRPAPPAREAMLAGARPMARRPQAQGSPFWGERQGPFAAQERAAQAPNVEVLGEGPDGAQLIAEFPPGTRILGVRNAAE